MRNSCLGFSIFVGLIEKSSVIVSGFNSIAMNQLLYTWLHWNKRFCVYIFIPYNCYLTLTHPYACDHAQASGQGHCHPCTSVGLHLDHWTVCSWSRGEGVCLLVCHCQCVSGEREHDIYAIHFLYNKNLISITPLVFHSIKSYYFDCIIL